MLRSEKLLAIRQAASADKSETHCRQDEIGVQKGRKQESHKWFVFCAIASSLNKNETLLRYMVPKKER